MKRHSKMAFMANHYVFPGGAVDQADLDPQWTQAASGQHELVADENVGYRVAAVRELFEESGILLGSTTSNTSTSTHDRPRRVAVVDDLPNLEQWRSDVHDDATKFVSVGVTPDVGSIHPWARWVTPKEEKRRFDTWFYLAVLPEGCRLPDATADLSETTDVLWMSPSEALKARESGRIRLAPPTTYTLLELSRYTSLEGVLGDVQHRSVAPISPRFRIQANKMPEVMLPGDHTYVPPPSTDGVSHTWTSRVVSDKDALHRVTMIKSDAGVRYWVVQKRGVHTDIFMRPSSSKL